MPGSELETNGESLLQILSAELVARTGAPAAPDSDSLRAAVVRFWQRARKGWPELDFPAESYFRHVATHLPADAPIEPSLDQLHAADLYIAAACGAGDRAALLAFEAAHLSDLRIAVGRVGADAAGFDDVKQNAWQKLFVGDAATPPKILDYSGQGRLRYWFRVAVVRMLLDARRKSSEKPVEDERLLGIEAPEKDPELEYLRRLYSHQFREAFEQAVQLLRAEDRNALRAHYVERLSIDQIGVMLGLHRATAARRVASARDRLLAETRRCLSARLGLSRTELESVMRLVQSGLHVSLQRLLA